MEELNRLISHLVEVRNDLHQLSSEALIGHLEELVGEWEECRAFLSQKVVSKMREECGDVWEMEEGGDGEVL